MSHRIIDVDHPVLGRHKVQVTWDADDKGAAIIPSYVEGSIRCPDNKCSWTCKKREPVHGLDSNASEKVYSTLRKELKSHLILKHRPPKRKR